MSSPSIHIPANTVVGYGRTAVAKAVEEIELAAGNHFLLARNGRGKTTLLRTLARSLRPLAGQPQVHGRLQFIGEDLAFDGELPARVIFKSMLSGAAVRQALDLAEKAELATKKPFAHLSKGNRQKVLLILAEFRAIPTEPSIILLDEPFPGADTVARECFLEVWANRTQGVLRLITTHPDYDSMDLHRPVIITDAEIRMARPEEGQAWGQLKTHLN